ncbi:MAG: hypothetical protein ACKOEX_06285 [Planctomycetia bacterium]
MRQLASRSTTGPVVFFRTARAAVCGWCMGMAFACGSPAARAADPDVLGIVAIDSYGDLKKQLTWVGGQVGQPGLAAIAESLLMVATQGRGLAGLDVSRPLGVIVTANGPMPLVHGYVPVKNLDKLLESLEAAIGPTESDGDVRRLVLPSGITIDFVERETPSGAWAVAGIPGTGTGVDDPLPLLEKVVSPFSIGAELFPSLMPEPLRKQLEMLLDRAAGAAEAQGQRIDPDAVRAFVATLRDTESLALGIAIDPPGKQLFLETSSTQVAGSDGASSAAAPQIALTVGAPEATEGSRPTIRGYVAHAVPTAVQTQITASLDAALATEDDDPLAASLGSTFRSLVAAMMEAGGLDAAITVDTSRVTKDAPLPELTLGARIKDGAALEARVKKLLGKASSLPPGMKVAFDTGKAGAATLHTISLDLAETPAEEQFGKSADLTLAVAPKYAFGLAGGDVQARAAAGLAASGKPDANARPIAGLQMAIDGLLSYGASMADGDEAEQTAKAAATAREAGGGTLELSMRPIERGIATRLSVDAAALKAGAAMANAGQGAAGGVPLPQGFPIPLPVR